ncbi:MAG: hypothetical protein HYS59_01870 [Candidatus Vogelbacteria bacterium]|nr:hypothetical protein [Candidatus Vogelbacteria bacterium]
MVRKTLSASTKTAVKKKAAKLRTPPKPRQKKKENETVSAMLSAGPNAARTVAHGVHCFWVNNGPVVCTLIDLRDAMQRMSDEQYLHHTSGRNDFANWVRDVLDDLGGAFALAGAMHREDAVSIIDELLTYA